ncbi:hypothetical protein [Bradyrhizobium sp. CCBAU 65884]|uniref:hypothetical protein n=1 Tax=Bradyrhizobium sp. CCBAU 65884 TaxID=722477 RepID=UPI002305BC85|nr:hypothetical protein [Bradyrhizobium sp. CCBAU 65884]
MAKVIGATIVVASGAADRPTTQVIAGRLQSLGLKTWTIENDVLIGESKIKALDDRLRSSAAMVLVRCSGEEPDEWAQRQEFSFRAQLKRSSDLKLIVVPQRNSVVEKSLYGHAIVLPDWVGENQIADLSAAAIKFNPDLSSVRAPLPDNPNAPLLSAGAWSLQSPELEFDRNIDRILSLQGRRNYDEASDLYWKTLHFSGYRSRWDARLKVSRHISDLAEREGDVLNRGLVFIKGIAYLHLTCGDYTSCLDTLKRADGELRGARDRRLSGFCWSYLGDIEAQWGRPSRALECYAEAVNAMAGLEQHNVVLKARMVKVLSGASGIPSRLRSLSDLRQEFSEVHNYRAGIVDMVIAETLRNSGEYCEAIAHSARAVNLFRNVINMPRNTRRAEALHLAILERKPSVSGDDPW